LGKREKSHLISEAYLPGVASCGQGEPVLTKAALILSAAGDKVFPNLGILLADGNGT
jgi:hypothetical protein